MNDKNGAPPAPDVFDGCTPAPVLSPVYPPVTLRVPFRSYLINLGLPVVLLAFSTVTTTAIGARFMQNFHDGLPPVVSESDLWPWPWLLADTSRFLLGWPFSVALLGILLTHEFGHYFACRYHGVRTTLPWVLPAPTLSGTAGAVIQIRGRIPSRHALIDIGIYGPLVGYIASLLAVVLGFLLSRPAPPDSSGQILPLIQFGQPLTFRLIHRLLAHLQPGSPAFTHATAHPVLIAGWVGLFITSLNLIPAGQLDGGHILYALAPRWHKRLTYAIPAALLLCGIVFWIGWLLWAGLLLLPAMRHPRVTVEEPLNRGRLILCGVALLLFLLTFSVEPFAQSSVLHYLNHPAF